ncbi:sensor histidine kinase [Nocardia panacis]|uniref:histidine kinase n=1 Tax=Nocardia panacis TaxID=2340916 RepID=A0A3A4KCK9_9NOCA|nr:HAMP domain-containing sensor histidine kinase [Nocardia panacis]RJO79818.1 sensor histidine kinase [Nocardia panacis]
MTQLRRLRVRLTLVVGVVSLVLVGGFSYYLSTVLDQRTELTAHRAAAERVGDLAALPRLDQAPESLQYNAWVLETSGKLTSLGETDLGVPLDLAEAVQEDPEGGAQYSEVWTRYSHFVEAARARSDGRVVVAAMSLDDYDADTARHDLVVGLGALGLIAALTLAAWLLGGRMLAPFVRTQQTQRDFLADAAHELRTPIAVIRAAASQALARPREPEQYVRTLTEIRDATERAGEGVVQLLDLARLEAGQVEAVRAPLRVDLLAEEIVATEAARDTAVELTEVSRAVVDGDDVLLRQAIDNLVRNASQRATHVWVGVQIEGAEAVVTVSDNGPGFDQEMLPHVFRRFARGHGHGHGLGLAMVRSIVALHGGRAEAANRPEGGAVVRIHLPLSTAGSA